MLFAERLDTGFDAEAPKIPAFPGWRSSGPMTIIWQQYEDHPTFRLFQAAQHIVDEGQHCLRTCNPSDTVSIQLLPSLPISRRLMQIKLRPSFGAYAFLLFKRGAL